MRCPDPNTAQAASLSDAGRMLDAHRAGVSAFSQPTADFVLKQVRKGTDLSANLEYDIADHIPGPVLRVACGVWRAGARCGRRAPRLFES